MRRDSRLSGVLHVLLHMEQKDGPVTSEVLAKAMDTNPVVLRRVMAGLRDQGYVQSATFLALSGTKGLQGMARIGPSVFQTMLN